MFFALVCVCVDSTRFFFCRIKSGTGDWNPSPLKADQSFFILLVHLLWHYDEDIQSTYTHYSGLLRMEPLCRSVVHTCRYYPFYVNISQWTVIRINEWKERRNEWMNGTDYRVRMGGRGKAVHCDAGGGGFSAVFISYYSTSITLTLRHTYNSLQSPKLHSSHWLQQSFGGIVWLHIEVDKFIVIQAFVKYTIISLGIKIQCQFQKRTTSSLSAYHDVNCIWLVNGPCRAGHWCESTVVRRL